MPKDLDSCLPMVHPRTQPMQRARIELARFLMELREKHSITPSERFSLLGEMIVDEASWCIRSERNPKPDDGEGED